MPRDQRTITADDIMELGAYETIRADKRQENILRKKFRRLAVGPHVTVLVEKGGDEQLVDELAAYNPMIPNGRELTCTLMFEIDDPTVRARVLGSLGGIEDHFVISVDGERIFAIPEDDVERSRADGKTSSVHFLHFPFTDAQVARWRSGQGQAMFHIEHPNYGHIALINDAMRRELATDFS